MAKQTSHGLQRRVMIVHVRPASMAYAAARHDRACASRKHGVCGCHFSGEKPFASATAFTIRPMVRT
jgi:hypothetical protein